MRKARLGLAVTVAVAFIAGNAAALPHYGIGKGTGSNSRRAGGVSHVNGYVNSHGTYVAPYYRTAPNGTKLDNWSNKPNVNPYTGKEGTKDPYATGD